MVRKTINYLLCPDIPASHSERGRLAGLVYRYLLASAAVAGSIALLFALTGSISSQHLVIILAAAAGALVMAWVVRRGEVEIGVWSFVLLGCMATTLIAVSSGGIQNPVVGAAFIVLILVA